ncbi:MAG: hypothetical protein ISR65_10375 [Bacteriovoracaceae bacterium]|nr:hypothetical protein [Bacteriovoracaceae bacterium]
MPHAQRTEVFDIDINKFFDVIADYESYPEFVDGVSEIEILQAKGNVAKVQYSLNLIKKFTYVLELKQTRPTKLSWKLLSGDIFKSNEGFWELKDLGEEKTEVNYSLDVTFNIFAPKMLVKKLVTSNLPSMMQSYYKRAKNYN